MKNFVQLDGNMEMIIGLLNTLVEPLCAFEKGLRGREPAHYQCPRSAPQLRIARISPRME